MIMTAYVEGRVRPLVFVIEININNHCQIFPSCCCSYN